MRQTLFAVSLGLILVSCAYQVPAINLRLHEPILPDCLIEQAPAEGRLVGRYEFAPSFVEEIKAAVNSIAAMPAALGTAVQCAADTSKALREAVGVIRAVNAAK